MTMLLDQLADRRQFILYRLEPNKDDPQKTDKLPTHDATGGNIDAHDRAQWMLPAEAALWARLWNAAKPPDVIGLRCGSRNLRRLRTVLH
jgi:hypothetical protein